MLFSGSCVLASGINDILHQGTGLAPTCLDTGQQGKRGGSPVSMGYVLHGKARCDHASAGPRS